MRTLRTAFRAVVRSPIGAVAFALLGLLVVVAIVGPAVWGGEARSLDIGEARQGVSGAHLLGTDRVGRDVLARVLVATRLSLELAAAAAGIGTLLGIPIGAVTGILGPRLQRLVGRGIQLGLVFPGVLVALFLTTVIGPGAVGATIAIGVALAPGFARTAQTLAASIASSEYVAAARAVGIGRRRLLLRYVLPNISETLVLQVTSAVSVALVAVAALSFLGLGVQAPDFDWGALLGEGLAAIYVTPSVALAPAVAIILAGLTFNLLGEALARGLNPMLRARSARVAGGRAEAPRPSAPAGADAGQPVLSVRGLEVRFPRGDGSILPVAGVSFDVAPGEIVGIVGESGSGKTMLSLALANLVPHPGRVSAERLEFLGRDLRSTPRRELQRLLGTKMAIVFQDPMSSLNPVLKIGSQLTEAVEVHQGMPRREARELALRRLADVHIPGGRRRLRQYPHEYSGGMRQRAMIAMGLMGEPALIVADEPTTALDVTVQAQILDLLREVNERHGTAIVLISHDLAVIRQLCTRVFVMYAGQIVEILDVDSLVEDAAHPYTRALLEVVPDLETPREEPLAAIPGRPPDLADLPAGCSFAPRCPLAVERSWCERPVLEEIGPRRSVACWVALDRARGREEARV